MPSKHHVLVFGADVKKPLCVHCGKPRYEHKAVTFHCPKGSKHRTLGYMDYSKTDRFQEKKA